MLSICIPTWNRAQCLDHTLTKIQAEFPDCEIVVADNSSTDTTPEVVAAHQKISPIVYIRNREVPINIGHALAYRYATRPFVTIHCDDDSILPNVRDYVAQLERRPELVAVYSDYAAWDDDKEQEFHKYFNLNEAFEFTPDQPIQLMHFICGGTGRLIYPEVGVFRRDAFLRSDVMIGRGILANHSWMYRMSRLGIIRFEASANAYYREHRILKPHLRRTQTVNMRSRLEYIGDELRNVLENIMLGALKEAGHHHCPEAFALEVRRSIERFMHLRLELEVQRAANEKNFIHAVDLAKRYLLWIGRDIPRDLPEMAAYQQIAETCLNMGAPGVCFIGMKPDRFHAIYPEIPLCRDDDAIQVHARDHRMTIDGKTMFFDRLLEQYS